MSALAARPYERGALRTLGMFGAIGLGGVAVYLVVVGHTQKQVQIGLLVGLWGVMLGAFTLFGPRRTAADDVGEQGDDGSTWVAGKGELVSAERREHELQLEVILRREMERVLRDEMAELRGEVAGLRTDLLDKMNGQLRLERVETTRVISSDIDELQHEVRRLAVAHSGAQALGGGQAFPPARLVESSPLSPPQSHASGPLPYVFGAPRVAQALPAVSAPRPAAGAPVPRPTIAPDNTARPPAPAPAKRPMPTPAKPVTESLAGPSTSWSTPASVAPRSTVAAPPATRPAPPPVQTSWRVDLPEPNLIKSASENVTNVLPDVAPRQPLPKPEPMRLGEAPHVAELPRVSELPRIGDVPRIGDMPRLTPPAPILPPAPLPAAPVTPPAPAPVESDPFAGMPRLSRYEADEWGDAPRPLPAAPPPVRESTQSRPRPNQYVGRRRQANGSPLPYGAPSANGANGTSAINGTPATNGVPPVNGTPAPYSPPAANGSYPAPAATGYPANGGDNRAAGGRRRRTEGDADDVLARLLGR